MSDPRTFSRWRPHPWHGLDAGPDPPRIVRAFIEITPYDLVKYEIDKGSGYVKVDRPQRTSSQPPALYGFVPKTYCGERVARLCPGAARGDGDPLDICVISERPISRGEVLLSARVIGGLQMLDHGEADDKIVGVPDSDYVWGGVEDVSGLPAALVERLTHYFTTYKLHAGDPPGTFVASVYGAATAHRVIEAALEDYRELFGDGDGGGP